ncbi:phage major capsid protein [bacterium]|nr:phage major capsid protein [bacterium]
MSGNTELISNQARLRAEYETKKATAKALLGKEHISDADVTEAEKLTTECKKILSDLERHGKALQEVNELEAASEYTSTETKSNGVESRSVARMRGNLGSAEAILNWQEKRATASWGFDESKHNDLASYGYLEAFGRWVTGKDLSNADKNILDVGLCGSYRGVPEYMMPIAVKDLTLASSASAGLMAPYEFRPDLVQRPPGLSPLYNMCTRISTSAKQLDLPRSTSTDANYPSAIRVTQVNERPTVSGGGFPEYEHKATDPAFEQVSLSVGTRMAYLDISESLTEDWVGCLSYVNGKLDESFVLDREAKILLGSGTNGAIQGMITLLKSSETLKPTRVASGSSGTFTAANVISVDSALEDPYDTGAVWLMRKATVNVIGGFTQSNKQTFFEPMKPWGSDLLNKPIVRSGFMPLANDSTNKVPLLLVNMASFYVVERVGMAVRLNPWIRSGTIRVEARSRETGKQMEPWWCAGLECVAS